MTDNKRRALQDMNLLDNFLFGSVVTYPDIGEDFTKEMMSVIFGRDFEKLKITPQKVYYGSNTNLHGARLDVYIEEDGARTMFLYTKGTEGNPPEELRQFLRYMESTREENVVNPQLEKIHQMVERVKRDEEVELALMKIREDDDVIREEALEEGRAQGRAEERANTERERMRAEEEKARADAAEKELQALRKMLEQQNNT